MKQRIRNSAAALALLIPTLGGANEAATFDRWLEPGLYCAHGVAIAAPTGYELRVSGSAGRFEARLRRVGAPEDADAPVILFFDTADDTTPGDPDYILREEDCGGDRFPQSLSESFARSEGRPAHGATLRCVGARSTYGATSWLAYVERPDDLEIGAAAYFYFGAEDYTTPPLNIPSAALLSEEEARRLAGDVAAHLAPCAP